MSQIEAVLVDLARIAEPATAAPADLASRVLKAERRRRTRRRSVLAGAVVVAGGLAAAAAHGGAGRYREYTVPSASMSPTIGVGDFVDFDPNLAPVDSDVVVAQVGAVGGATVVKRLVGTAGQIVSCLPAQTGGSCDHLVVDGREVAEPYLAGGPGDAFGPVRVPAGDVFLLGDDREISADSRLWGPVPATDVIGVAVSVTTPGHHPRGIPGAPVHEIPAGSDIQPAQRPPAAQASAAP